MTYRKSDSDDASLASAASSSASSPPIIPAYSVQLPCSSNDGDKSSSLTDSPSRHSSSSSRNSATLPLSSSSSSAAAPAYVVRPSKNHRRRSAEKWWRYECPVIEEDDDEGFYYGCDNRRRREVSKTCQAVIGGCLVSAVFAVFCLVIWGVSRPFKPQIAVQSMRVHNFYLGQGLDMTGVPTKLLTSNCTLNMNVYNPAPFFSIHVASTPLNLLYYGILVATGRLKNHYQRRKSRGDVSVNVIGTMVPLYGAGASLVNWDRNGGVPMRLEFVIKSRGDVVGKLVKTTHTRHVSCSIRIGSDLNEPIEFKDDTCIYD